MSSKCFVRNGDGTRDLFIPTEGPEQHPKEFSSSSPKNTNVAALGMFNLIPADWKQWVEVCELVRSFPKETSMFYYKLSSNPFVPHLRLIF